MTKLLLRYNTNIDIYHTLKFCSFKMHFYKIFKRYRYYLNFEKSFFRGIRLEIGILNIQLF